MSAEKPITLVRAPWDDTVSAYGPKADWLADYNNPAGRGAETILKDGKIGYTIYDMTDAARDKGYVRGAMPKTLAEVAPYLRSKGTS